MTRPLLTLLLSGQVRTDHEVGDPRHWLGDLVLMVNVELSAQRS
jgi:hypothetical protein